MKTPQELAEEYSLSLLPDPRDARLLCSARKDFLAGYQAARDQFGDTSKVMNSPEDPDSCEHILDMEKMVDVNSSNNSNGWISVKDRLPEENQTVLIYTDKHETYMARIYDNNEAWPISNSCGCCGSEEKFTHWMPLPQPPKEES